VPRSLAAALSPSLAGWMLGAATFAWPLLLAGALKIAYDLALLARFRHIRPPEEQQQWSRQARTPSGRGFHAGTSSLPSAATIRLRPPGRQRLKRFQIVGTLPVSLLSPTVRECAPWRTAMAKGQKRSNREAKKPKADKKKDLASTGTVSNALAKPKPGAATPESKK
jgi:hypothetical protein